MPTALPGGALKPQLAYISPCSVLALSWAQGRPSGAGGRAHEPERAPGWWERVPRWGGLRWRGTICGLGPQSRPSTTDGPGGRDSSLGVGMS